MLKKMQERFWATRKRKEEENKGFTLVELIVVIAILAILAVILVPNVLRYVERSRVTSDFNALQSIENAVKTACADPDINASTGDFVFGSTAANDGSLDVKDATGNDKVIADVVKTVGESVTLKSTEGKKITQVTCAYDADKGTVTTTIAGGKGAENGGKLSDFISNVNGTN